MNKANKMSIAAAVALVGCSVLSKPILPVPDQDEESTVRVSRTGTHATRLPVSMPVPLKSDVPITILSSPAPDAREATPSIALSVTSNATAGIYNVRAQLVSGIYQSEFRQIREKRDVERFGEWRTVTDVHIQHVVERDGDVYQLVFFPIPGYSENADMDAGSVFRWSGTAWEYHPGFTGTYEHQRWLRQQQVNRIIASVLNPLTDGQWPKFSFVEANLVNKAVTLRTHDGTRSVQITTLEDRIPLCLLSVCGGYFAENVEQGKEFFLGKVVESPKGLVLVHGKEERGITAVMPNGSGFTPRWLAVSVWIQRSGQEEWEKRTSFTAQSGNTVFCERVSGVHSPYGDEDGVLLFGDIPTLFIEERFLFE